MEKTQIEQLNQMLVRVILTREEIRTELSIMLNDDDVERIMRDYYNADCELEFSATVEDNEVYFVCRDIESNLYRSLSGEKQNEIGEFIESHVKEQLNIQLQPRHYEFITYTESNAQIEFNFEFVE